MSEQKWVLVPEPMTDEMFDAWFDGSDHQESWANMLAARPPIPAKVFAAMVERGALAMAQQDMMTPNVDLADICLRAALGISDE